MSKLTISNLIDMQADFKVYAANSTVDDYILTFLPNTFSSPWQHAAELIDIIKFTINRQIVEGYVDMTLAYYDKSGTEFKHKPVKINIDHFRETVTHQIHRYIK